MPPVLGRHTSTALQKLRTVCSVTLPRRPVPNWVAAAGCRQPPPANVFLVRRRSLCVLRLHCAGLSDPSALFRHEVAYCLGQRQDPAAVTTLERILEDEAEHPM